MTTARRTTLLTSLGAGLEYYDFIIYGMMAGHLSSLFFASDNSSIALMKTFGIFAVGYLARPLGGILFGLIGDTRGRKNTFLMVMLLMALATFGIGLLPTYSQIGMLAPCLLLLLRLLQGLSFGAELPGAITVVTENTQRQSRGIYSGFVISSVSLGATLASLVLYILTQNVGRESILQWGWRIPFLLGGLLAAANYFIRKYLDETPEFATLQATRKQPALQEPLLTLVKTYKKEIACGIGMTGFVSSLVIFALYLPTYLGQHFQQTPSDVYLAMTWGLVWSALSMPLCGWIADRVGRVKTYIVTCLGFALSAFALFHLLHNASLLTLIAFMVLYQTTLSFLSVGYFTLLSAAFPTAVRYTGVALCYNVTYSIMGCAPMVITALIAYTNAPSLGIWFLISFALIGAVSCGFLSRQRAIATLES